MNAPADFTVFARDYPETRLLVEVRGSDLLTPEQDPEVRQLARSIWGANCHYGLVVTPGNTYVLQDDFQTSGPESIRITDVIPTATLLSRVNWPPEGPISEEMLKVFTERWLGKLTRSYDEALPDVPEVIQVFFPNIVGAVAEGRVVPGVPA
jgi:hypothetical protein